MIASIMKKDWSLLWPMVAIVTILQISLAWFAYNSGLFGSDLAPRELRQPLTLAWFVAIGALAVAVVHQDALPGVDQDWLVRPVARTDLLLAKLLFALLVICAPMLLLDSALVMAAGFSLSASLPALLYKEVYFLLCFLVPVMALAAITATMTELLLLGAALIAIFATALSVDAWLFGAEHCPTCGTGASWIQHVLQHAGILLGAGVILGVQYYRRRTEAARVVAVIGTLALVFGQLPWSAGFGIQRRLSPAPNSAQAIGVVYDDRQSSAPRQEGAAATGTPRYPLSAPRNRLGGVVGYLERHGSAGAPATLLLPVRIGGLRPDELLLIDRSDVSLLAEGGSIRYRGANPEALYPPGPVQGAAADRGDAPRLLQAIELPARVYRDFAAEKLRLRIDYSLTLMKVAGQFVVPAANGALLTDELGACATRPDQGDSQIRLRCQKIGRAPFCLGVIVRSATGRENPEFFQCDPDYRPYLPGATTPLSIFGMDIPIRDPIGLAHYPLEAAPTSAVNLLIKVYVIREHALRSLLTPTTRLMDLSGGQGS
jgi:hypothetical protein